MADLRAPEGLNIELTTSCPLHCPQCYCTLEGARHIPLDTAGRVMRQAAALGVTHVELSGGETLCYPHLTEAVKAAVDCGLKPSIAISGWGFTEDKCKEIIGAGIDTIYVSLNGPTPESNALSRNGYDYAVSALKILQESGFEETVINWVMHRNTADLLPEMLAIAEKYSVKAILIIDPKPTSSGQLETYPTYEQLVTTASYIKRPISSVELIVQHCFSPLLALSRENKLWGNLNRGVYKGCTAGIVSFSVSVDGLFSPCRHLEIYEKWDSVEEYWNKSPVLNEIRSLGQEKGGACAQCRLKNNCRPCLADHYSRYRELCFENKCCPMKRHP